MAETVLPPLQGEWVLHTQNVRSSEPTRVGQMISPDQKSRVTRKLLGAVAYSLAIAIGFLISDWVWRKPWENGQTLIVIGLAIAFFIRWLARIPKSQLDLVPRANAGFLARSERRSGFFRLWASIPLPTSAGSMLSCLELWAD